MARAPFATWRGSPNYTSGALAGQPRGVVFHVEQGTEQGTDAVFAEPTWQASSHFGNPKVGPPDQYVDSADKAWAEADGNTFWWSIEHEGLSGEPLNDNQIRNDAQIIAWLRAEHGDPFPLQLTDDPNGQGLGWHGMGGNAWGGHFDCPGEPIKAQRRAVIDLINHATPTTPQEDDMPTVAVRRAAMNPDGSGDGYLLDCEGGIHTIGNAKPITGVQPPPPYWKDTGAAVDFGITDWDRPAGWTLDCKGAVHGWGGYVARPGSAYWQNAFVPPAPQV